MYDKPKKVNPQAVMSFKLDAPKQIQDLEHYVCPYCNYIKDGTSIARESGKAKCTVCGNVFEFKKTVYTVYETKQLER